MKNIIKKINLISIIHLLVISLFLLCSSHFSYGQKTGVIEIKHLEQFKHGKFENTFLSEQDILSLTPGCKLEHVLDEIIIWKILKTENGIYAATGHRGKIIHIDNNKKTHEIKTASHEMTSIKQGPDGRVYIGSGPKGILYRLSEDGKEAEVLAILPALFIWDITFQGNTLIAATGNMGTIYKVDVKTGEFEKYFTSSEENILRVEASGGVLFASTSGQGYLYEITSPDDYKVIYDANEKDINDFAIHKNKIYLSTTGKKLVNGEGHVNGNGNGNGNGKNMRKKNYYKNSVIVIDEERSFTEILTLKNQTIPTLIIKDDNHLLAATSEKGEIYSIDLTTQKPIKLFELPENSLSHFINYKDEIYFAAGINANIYHLSLKYFEYGNYISDVFDTQEVASWGKINFKNYAENDLVEIYVRVGNTFIPDETWSKWIKAKDRSILNAPSRFIQIQLELKEEDNSSPKISDITIHYTKKNHRPVIESFQIGRNREIEKSRKLNLNRKDFLISWKANDPDGDTLLYEVYLRRGEEKEWELLKEDIEKSFFVINRYALISGEYQFKLIARDSKDNNETTSYYVDFITRKITVDNVPPRMVNVNIKPTQIKFVVEDDVSFIKSLKYSFDKKDYVHAYPTDRVFDDTKENFSISITNESKEIIIHSEDSSGNFIYQSYPIKP